MSLSVKVVVILVLCLGFLPAHLRAEGPVLSEFLALSSSGLKDLEGRYSDWIEVHNPGSLAVDLAGWSLTDDPGLPRQWGFPAIDLEPGAFLVVFATGDDRRDPAGELHASFRLSGEGEYLALVGPQGVAHQYAPRFPPQRENISYGLSMEAVDLAPAGAPVDYLVPTDGGLGTSWTLPDFMPDGRWSRGATGVGYQSDGGSLPRPLSYFSLDGTFEDLTGPNEGSFEGDATPDFVEGHDGAAGGALSFQGGQTLELFQGAGLPLHNHPAYTVALWVKGLPQADKRVYSEGSTSSNTPLFTIGTDAAGASGKVDIFVRNQAGAAIVNHRLSSGIAFDGEWHHLAWVDRGGQAALYIDGALDAADFNYSKQPLALDVASIGSVMRATACCFFTGAIDEAALWDRALDALEITSLAEGASPLGDLLYARLIGTDVEGLMAGVSSSIYLRLPLSVADPLVLDSLVLRMRYDDGFIAYLNGVEVARRNGPALPQWNSAATAPRRPSEAVAPEELNISAHRDVLRQGANVLAVHGLNSSAGDGGFLVLPELVASSSRAEPRYFAEPTPGAPNRGGAIDFVADTRFSHDRGFYEAPFLLEISTATPGATIRYTTDFSAPSETRGQVYAGPIPIGETTAVRALAHKAGYRATNVDTQTYVFLSSVIRQPQSPPGRPATWQPGWSADYEMDPEICTLTGSPRYVPTIKEDLKAIPTISLVLEEDGLFGPVNGIYNHSENQGLAWERAASMELFSADGKDGIQLNCGLRMQGGASRFPDRQPKHSFRLLFKAPYGPTKLRHRLFEDSPVEEFDTVVLRSFFTDGWSTRYQEPRYKPDDAQYMRDVWMKDSLRAMGQPSTHNTYVHLYINGLYWGLYNPAERPDASFQAHYHGGEKEEWDIIKDFGEVMNGTRAAWNQMQSLAAVGLASSAAYQAIQGLLEVDNLIDYMILHIHAAAEDWPHHNWYAARNPNDLGAGFRFFVWDQEIVLDTVTRNRIEVSNPDTPAFIYSRLRENAEFRLRFADRVRLHLENGGALSPAASIARLEERARQIEQALTAESARWGDVRRTIPFTRDVEWRAVKARITNQYFPGIHPLSLQRFRGAGLYPALAAPAFNRHGGRIPPTFRLTMDAPQGSIHYTLDGQDPRLPGGAAAPSARLWTGAGGGNLTLVDQGAPVRVLVPADGGLGLDWTAPGFDAGGWLAGTTGVGYERSPSSFQGLIGTGVGERMDGLSATVYLRITFTVDDPASLPGLVLRMKYDDGFVAYLNGAEVASGNAPPSPRWDSQASAPRLDAEAIEFQDFDLGARLSLLRRGENVLALHGLNYGKGSNDLLILPSLEVPGTAGGGLPLPGTTEVKARTLSGGQWSALNQALFFHDVPLRLTEVMYHPPEPPPGSPFGAESFEFLELENTGQTPLDLSGLRLEGGIEFDFSSGAVRRLLPGDLVLVVEDVEAFQFRYQSEGMRIAGQYRGNLANGGEAIRLRGPAGEPLLEVWYRDWWIPSTDGGGRSLVSSDPRGDPERWGEAGSWRESGALGGSPGVDESVGPPVGGLQLPGDSNQDGMLDLADSVSILFRLFVGEEAPPPPCEGSLGAGGNLAVLDLDGDGLLRISDAIHGLTYLFRGGPPPVSGDFCLRVPGCPSSCRE